MRKQYFLICTVLVYWLFHTNLWSQRQLSITYTSFPIDIEVNPKYQEYSGEVTDPLDNRGYLVQIRGLSIPISMLGLKNIGFGYAYLSPILHGIQIDFGAEMSYEYIPKVLDFYVDAKIGAVWTFSSQNWRTPEGQELEPLGDRGQAVNNPLWTFRIAGGLTYWPLDEIGVVVGVGYVRYFTSGDWSQYVSGDSDSEGKSYNIPDEFLQYKVNTLGGFAIELGIVFELPSKSRY
ncbi:MAG: hypothetical protein H8D45_21560 [Bacteroidetes bacterium]|nr:hypothetical protein [Bacteroidota bacterium]